MSRLPKVGDVENESSYGYVFGVSGPGELVGNFGFGFLICSFTIRSRYCRENERISYV